MHGIALGSIHHVYIMYWIICTISLYRRYLSIVLVGPVCAVLILVECIHVCLHNNVLPVWLLCWVE